MLESGQDCLQPARVKLEQCFEILKPGYNKTCCFRLELLSELFPFLLVGHTVLCFCRTVTDYSS